jgi:tRNA (guanine26-N2/guanine27-N2)-dimethyltransferase
MRLAVVREGKALLKIPSPEYAEAPHGLEPAWLPVFYNPKMVFNRDVSVLAYQAYIDTYAPHSPVNIVDALSGTGVRAVRCALECRGVGIIRANDLSERAFGIIKNNIILNGVENRVKPSNRDANSLLFELLREEPILAVDIDPFGSPAPFAYAA